MINRCGVSLGASAIIDRNTGADISGAPVSKPTAVTRWGILGLGNIAKAFAQGLAHAPGARLMACASRDGAKAQAFGEQWKIPRRHPSYEALARDPQVDAVYVATPHPMHREACLLCIEHGKAVLCEKPMGISAKDEAIVIDAARKKGVLLMEALWSRFLPHVIQAKALAASGAIGEPRLLQADFGFRCGGDPASRLMDPALAGGGLLDVGIYPVSLAHLFFGKPVDARATAHLGATGVDEQAGMLLRFGGGELAVLSCAVRTNSPQEALLLGTAGSLRLHAPWWRPSRLTLSQPGKDPVVIEPPHAGNGYSHEAMEFAHCLALGLKESPLLPLSESLSVMETLDTLRDQIGLRYPME
ncbi:MAG: Gfo/Idh/MocA family oxidoreductase [Spirochaetes bacterium]|nr:Gfo/Idh/MocA family oxidoreductase [Spirochaetota bacterium]